MKRTLGLEGVGRRSAMDGILIEHATVVLPDRLLPDAGVLCREGRIERVAPGREMRAHCGDAGALEKIDASGHYLAPGFIDLHIHGLHEHLINDGPEHLAEISRLLPRYGVTGFLPTLFPPGEEEGAGVLRRLAQAESPGALILGFHLEGPFLTLAGALPPASLGGSGRERAQSLIGSVAPRRAIFSVSPDYEGILDLLPLLARGGAPVFMTHTAADVRQTQAAIEKGVRHATHFYDVFPAPPETDPGVRPCGAVEVVLADPRVSVDFILDGEHVDPVAIKMALACKGPDRVCLITDANVGAGLPPGRYRFAESEIEFARMGGPARLTDSRTPCANSARPGALAGSGLTMDRAVRNAVAMLGADLPLAVRMASANPARVLGVHDRKGEATEGFDADLVLLDETLNVVQTWVRGECRYA